MNRRLILKSVWIISHLVCFYFLFLTSKLELHFLFTKFDLQGKPVGKMQASTFFVLMAAVIFITNSVLLLLLKFIHRLWPEFINLPYKRFWTSTPERQLQGLERAKDVLFLSGAFLGIVFAYNCVALEVLNRGVPSFLTSGLFFSFFTLSLVLFLFVLIWLFSKPPSTDHP